MAETGCPYSWLDSLFHGPRRQSSHWLWFVKVHTGQGDHVLITVDASLFGMGGVLQVNGTYVPYFGIPLSDDDVALHGYERGSANGQHCYKFGNCLSLSSRCACGARCGSLVGLSCKMARERALDFAAADV
eukprot:6385572-Amphidinium_carterae.1